MDEAKAHKELDHIIASLSDRHRHVPAVLLRRFHQINGTLIQTGAISPVKAHLIGAYFCEEYSFEAAALFSPSAVPHPDQSGVAKGDLRFVLSLRGVGEGHVSSITFRTGLFTAGGEVIIDPASPQAISPRIEAIPDSSPNAPGIRLCCDESRDLSEVVIFPISAQQRHGVEDLRLVRFIGEDGEAEYIGTYTAFGGEDAREELLRTRNFATLDLCPLTGTAALEKGMALFPRRIHGQYAMLARQDHESICLITSPDLYTWGAGTNVLSPRFPWEFVQLGNCGSPIEIAEGWLVLTHGVGAVRNYCLGACLLDKEDPTIVLGRLAKPLLRPSPLERDGYVPNIIYSCGGLLNGRRLLIPYAVADSFTSFATVEIDALIAAMVT